MQLASRNPALIFIMATVVIDTLGFSIIMPVMPALIGALTGGGPSEAARYNGILFFIFAVAQFFASPVLGNWSDAAGRRPVLLASLAAFAADYAVMGFAPSIWWLLIGRIISGIAGATYATAYAFVTDISDTQTRVKYFGFIGASFGAGFVIGPAIGGLLGLLGPRAPFYGAALLGLANFIFGYLCLPESLPPEKRRPFERERLNPLNVFAEVRKRPRVAPLVAALFIWQLSFTVFPSTWAFFGAYRFGWNPAWIGTTLALSGVTLIAVQGGLVGRMVKKFGERRTAIIGCLFGIIGFLWYGVVDHAWVMFVIIIVDGFSFVVNPSLVALMSHEVPEDEQGALQGVVAASMSMTMIIGPLLMTQIFAYFTDPHRQPAVPGAAFLTSAALAVAALATVLYATRGHRQIRDRRTA